MIMCSVMCSDLVYVLIFPHLFLVLFWNGASNSYGCLVSLIIAFALRVLGKEIDFKNISA